MPTFKNRATPASARRGAGAPRIPAGARRPKTFRLSQRQWPIATGRLAHASGQPAHCARHGQPHLALSLWTRSRTDTERLWCLRHGGQHTPRCSITWLTIHENGWSVKQMHEATATSRTYRLANDDQGGELLPSIPGTIFSGGPTGGDSMPNNSGMPCSFSAANSTARRADGIRFRITSPIFTGSTNCFRKSTRRENAASISCSSGSKRTRTSTCSTARTAVCILANAARR